MRKKGWKTQKRHEKAVRLSGGLHRMVVKQAEARGWTLAHTAEALIVWALSQPAWEVTP
jgi:hypothetical protein